MSDDEIPDMVAQFDESSIVIGKRTYFPTAADAARAALSDVDDTWYSIVDGAVKEHTIGQLVWDLGDDLLVESAEEFADDRDIVTVGGVVYYRDIDDANAKVA